MSSEKTVQELKKELQELETTMKEEGRDAVSNVKRNKLKKNRRDRSGSYEGTTPGHAYQY